MGAEHMKPQCEAELDEVIRMGTTIEQLIKELCPDGVPYRALGELAECIAGATPKKSELSYWTNGNIPWMSSGEVNKRMIWETDRCITQKGYDSCSTKMVPPGTVVIALAGQGKTRGLVARTRISLCTNQSLCSIICNKDLNSDYLYYNLQSRYRELREISSGDGTRGGLNLAMIRAISIPVPPVEVQEEIVRILDLFTTLEAELEAELEKRVAQYAYYRDYLLDYQNEMSESPERSNPGVEWTILGEVMTIVRGASPRPIQRYMVNEGEGTPWIKIGDVAVGGKYIERTEQFVSSEGALKSRRVSPGDFLLSNSMSFGRPYISSIEGCIHDGWLLLTDFSDSFDPNFLYHLLRSDPVQRQFEAKAGAGTVKNLNSEIVRGTRIPLPSLDTQRRIAGILDQMDALVNDLSSGLPAEIAARRKQYEYYRDRLLSFPELTEPAATASPNTQEPTRP